MLSHRGFSCWIEVDGQRVPEYMTSVDHENKLVQCFIAGEEGKRFSVHWKSQDNAIDTAGYISLDGYTVPGRFLWAHSSPMHPKSETYRSAARISQSEERPFTFMKAPVTSDTHHHHQQGTIKLTLKRIQSGNSVKANAFAELPSPRVMPGNALSVGFGAGQSTFEQYPFTWDAQAHPDDHVEGTKKPATWVTFIFKYRNKDWLDGQGIIPRPQRVNRGPSTMNTNYALPHTVDLVTSPTSGKVAMRMNVPVMTIPEGLHPSAWNMPSPATLSMPSGQGHYDAYTPGSSSRGSQDTTSHYNPSPYAGWR
ncbi:hypothetical protein DL96DRAFT_636240 [Flagelloscypha sp. PMI_526]|nr:hypothetical protein DL96DRAFT_636240 [Flagelloscypha sp. PMI_526]